MTIDTRADAATGAVATDQLVEDTDALNLPPGASTGRTGALRRLIGYVTARGSRVRLTISLALRAIAVVGLALLPLLSGDAIDAVASRDAGRLDHVVLVMAISIVVTGAASLIAERVTAVLSTAAVKRLQDDAFGSLQDVSMSYYSTHPPGDLVSRLSNDVEAIASWFQDALGPILRAGFQIVLFIGIMLLVDWRLTVVALLIVPLYLWGSSGIQRSAAPAYRELQETVGDLSAYHEETLDGHKVIIAHGRADWAVAANTERANRTYRVGRRAWLTSLSQVPLTTAATTLQSALVLAIGSIWVIAGDTTIGTLVAFVGYVSLLAGPMSDVAKLTSSTLNAGAAGRRVFEVIDARPTVVDAPDAVDYRFDGGHVVFERVDFSYRGPGHPLQLTDLSFDVLPGQKIGICGPSGAGKSTIINVLTRYYDIVGGRILLDGQDLGTLRQRSLRERIGMVPQEAFLFSASVMDNLRYARRDATVDEAVAAARNANCHDWIQRLPQGYDTVLTERGANLSQGQRQMLTIARAMVADPDILILDEATSNVDTRNERLINQAVSRLLAGRTSFVIAHRLSTIMDADRILVLDMGRLVESGSHDDLMARGGVYRRLFMSQFRNSAR